MLRELIIRNFALIEKLNIEFSNGLNVLTGETGAGKSILLDSIGLLCGRRASSDFIRRGEEKATVEGHFIIQDDLRLLLNKLDIIEIEENEIFMSREISVSGTNKCKINFKTVPLNIYQRIGSFLFDIHGQNQEQSIMSNEKQLELVDRFVKTTKKDDCTLEELQSIYQEYKNLLVKRKDLAFNEKEDMIAYYEYAIKEIDEANLSEEEDLQLKEDRTRIVNSEKLMKKAISIYSQLNENGIVDRLNSISFLFKEISSLDPTLETLTTRFTDLYYEIDSLNEEFKSYYNNLDYDENRINSIENRISEINKLKRKYGKTVQEIINKRNDMKEKVEFFANISQLKLDLEIEISNILEKYTKKAEVLSDLRKKAASKLTTGIKSKLKELNIYENGFDIDFASKEEPGEYGMDMVEFYFSPNIGEGVQPLKKIASGGEISRVMLAIKSVLAEYDIIPSLIFDEIDSGVGGEALLKVAEALEKIGRKRQVICVSHSAIMAAFSDRILAVSKRQIDGRTFIEAKNLDSEAEKIEELSRMLGGKENFNASSMQGKEMILFALSKKKV